MIAWSRTRVLKLFDRAVEVKYLPGRIREKC